MCKSLQVKFGQKRPLNVEKSTTTHQDRPSLAGWLAFCSTIHTHLWHNSLHFFFLSVYLHSWLPPAYSCFTSRGPFISCPNVQAYSAATTRHSSPTAARNKCSVPWSKYLVCAYLYMNLYPLPCWRTCVCVCVCVCAVRGSCEPISLFWSPQAETAVDC